MQEKHSLLTAKIQQLEKECDRLKDWEQKKNATSLKRSLMDFLRVLKRVWWVLQSAHILCNLFRAKFKAPLQQEKIRVGRRLSLTYHRCKSKVIFDSYLKHSDISEK